MQLTTHSIFLYTLSVLNVQLHAVVSSQLNDKLRQLNSSLIKTLICGWCHFVVVFSDSPSYSIIVDLYLTFVSRVSSFKLIKT